MGIAHCFLFVCFFIIFVQAAYHSSSTVQWSVGGGVAGEVRSGGGLTFAMVEAAGHMVPMDQPEAVSSASTCDQHFYFPVP